MGKEKVKNFIDNILNEKREHILSKIEAAKKNISTQLEELRQLPDFSSYDMPADLESTGEIDAAGTIGTIHKFIQQVSTADNQLNLINNILLGLNHFCSRAALFLIKDDKFAGWKGKGFTQYGGGVSDDGIKKVFFPSSADTVFKQVLDNRKAYLGPPKSKPEDHLIFSRFGGQSPDKIFVLPFFVKGKPQAVIYTDSYEGKHIAQKEIEILSILGEMSLDLLPLRQKILSRIKTREFIDEPQESEVKTVPPPPEDNEITLPSIKESDPERLARVIINDIMLYNKKQVEEGRKRKVLFQVLEDTIMQAKELYLIKYSNIEVFEKQLVKQLAQGDREALKGYKFESD